jgi:hypothetical protein
LALAITLTLERELPESANYAKAKSGKALVREAERLDLAARTKHVDSLESMLSESQAALAEQLRADGFDPAKMRLTPERWFAAANGLKTVRGLADHVTENFTTYKQPNALLKDLRAAEALLSAADAAGVRFHFARRSFAPRG